MHPNMKMDGMQQWMVVAVVAAAAAPPTALPPHPPPPPVHVSSVVTQYNIKTLEHSFTSRHRITNLLDHHHQPASQPAWPPPISACSLARSCPHPARPILCLPLCAPQYVLLILLAGCCNADACGHSPAT